MLLRVVALISCALSACEEARLEQRDPQAAVQAADASSAPRAADAAQREPQPERARGPLIEPEAWEIVSAPEDPFADRLEDASCPDGAYMPELLANEPVFSVDTSGCRYMTARQPALRDVAEGETLVARVWHFALNAGESAEAHVALRVGESVVLDETVPIPSEGGLIVREEFAPQAFPAGTPVFFHLHNHGDNSWSLVELSAGPKP
jgi:hypothetical protein